MPKLSPGEVNEQQNLLVALSGGLNEEEKVQLEHEIRAKAAEIYSQERQLWESLANDKAKITIMTRHGAVFSNKGTNYWTKRFQ